MGACPGEKNLLIIKAPVSVTYRVSFCVCFLAELKMVPPYQEVRKRQCSCRI